MDVQPTKRPRLDVTEDSGPRVGSDAFSVEFSSDPSQNECNERARCKSMDRAKWIKKISTFEEQKNTDDDIGKEMDNSSLSASMQAHKLLAELVQIVEPKSGKATAMRQIVRELRANITLQQNNLQAIVQNVN